MIRSAADGMPGCDDACARGSRVGVRPSSANLARQPVEVLPADIQGDAARVDQGMGGAVHVWRRRVESAAGCSCGFRTAERQDGIFDQTDMAAAKKKLGPLACVGGNVSASYFKAGTPQQMESYVKILVDTCAPGGAYFISQGAVLYHAQNGNIHTYLKAAKEHGEY